MERMSFNTSRVLSVDKQTWEVKKGGESSPSRMGKGGRKIVVPCPHDQVCQSNLANGHHLVLLVVQFIHHPLVGREVFQGAEQIALLLAVALLLAEFLMAPVIRPPYLDLHLLNLGIRRLCWLLPS